MKIAVFDIENWEKECFADLEAEHDITYVKASLSAENVEDHADAEVISTFIYSTIDGTVLSKLPNLKLIATRSTGVDHLDVDTCRERDITVCNVPTYGSNTVAEHVFGMLLTISHRLEEAIDRTRKGQFSPRGLQGFDLEGKTLGVVGTGAIGRHVIRIANGFGMKVLAFDVKPDRQAAARLGFDYVGIDELLSGSDIVTLHVPASPKTENMMSDEQFRKMKHGAVLINTARGKVVNTKALVRALAEGRLAAAGLDVLPMEPVIREEAELLRSVYEEAHDLSTLLADEVIARMRNVVVTPHSAFNTREAVQRILDTTVDNIRAYANGHAEHVVVGPAPAAPAHS